MVGEHSIGGDLEGADRDVSRQLVGRISQNLVMTTKMWDKIWRDFGILAAPTAERYFTPSVAFVRQTEGKNRRKKTQYNSNWGGAAYI